MQQPRTCHLCEAMCGLLVEVEGDRVGAARGDPDDPFSQGHVCPKGAVLGELHQDPDRLVQPLRRQGDRWEPVGWSEALDAVAEGLVRIRGRHGPRSVALYLGNPVVHNMGALLGGQALGKSLSTISRYSASSVDQIPKQLSNWLLYGHQFLFPIPDVDRTDLLVIVGANPLASNGSLMTAPGIRGRLRAIQERGRVVVLDPRRTRTAALADEHHFVRPGTDAFVFAALARELLEAEPEVELPVVGRPVLRKAVAPFTPEVAEAASGVPATAIRALARGLRTTERSVLYARLGTCTQAWGTLCSWLADVINLLAGSLDRPGGAMFPEPAADFLGRPWLIGSGSRGRWASRVRGAPEVMGELPVATFAEDVLEPGEDRIRALVTVAGNPARSAPGSRRFEQALQALELQVAVDPYLNETTRHADWILPPASPLCEPHYDLVFHHLTVRNTARWSEPLVEQPGGTRTDFEILTALAPKVAWRRGERRRALSLWLRKQVTPARLVDWLLRGGRTDLTLRKLREHPHGIDLGPLRPCLRERMPAEALDLAPSLILEELGRLAEGLDEGAGAVLIGRRHLRSNNSWMHNVRSLVKGRDRCTLQVHPRDAERWQLVDGARARITSAAGEVVAPVEVTDAVMEGVVSLPHGWGHDEDGVRQQIAREHAGVNANALTDPEHLDGPSGNAVLNGVSVEVAPV